MKDRITKDLAAEIIVETLHLHKVRPEASYTNDYGYVKAYRIATATPGDPTHVIEFSDSGAINYVLWHTAAHLESWLECYEHGPAIRCDKCKYLR
jgi:hypothetical protein